VTVGLLVLASVTIITLDYRGGGRSAISGLKRAAHEAFSPVQSGVDGVLRPIGSFLAGAVHYGSVEQQNAKLRHELGQLQRQALSAQANRQTQQTLEQLANLPWVGNTRTVTAEVVALNPSDFEATIQLDKGTRSGVEQNMPVVGGAGLVGVVTEAWSSGSVVRLITDASSTVGVAFGGPPTLAEVQGQGTDKALAVNLIPPGTPGLTSHTILLTSGLQNASFPPNIPVARVTKFSSSPSSTQVSVSAVPLANLSSIQYVDVMLWEPSQ
jgi:rod shape-determining protein MreC